MSHGTGSADSLSQALSEFRTELLDWIDTELARLQEQDQEESLMVEERSAAPRSICTGLRGGSDPGSMINGEGSRPGGPDLLAGMGRETPRDDERLAVRNAKTEIAGPAVAVSGGETDPPPQANPLKPH